MVGLNDEQFVTIWQYVNRPDIPYSSVSENLADHLACLVEEYMNEQELAFERAFEEAQKQLSNQQVETIYQETIIQTHNFKTMKNNTFITGVVTMSVTLIGLIFKVMHWPGASILTMLGLSGIAGIFSPMLFRNFAELETKKLGKISHYIGMAGFSLLTISLLFAVQKWPGMAALFFFSVAILFALYLPTQIAKNLMSGENRSSNRSIVLYGMLLGGIILSLYIVLRRPSENYYQYVTSLAHIQEATTKKVAANTEIFNLVEQIITNLNTHISGDNPSTEYVTYQSFHYDFTANFFQQGATLKQTEQLFALLTKAYENKQFSQETALDLGIINTENIDAYEYWLNERFSHRQYQHVYQYLRGLQLLISAN